MADVPETTDPFEAELQSFRPADPPPELFDAIGRQLATNPRPRLGAMRAAVGIAACALVAAGVWRVTSRYDDTRSARISIATAPATPVVDSSRDDPPSLASYHRALSRSPAALDALLDQHAVRLLPRDRTAVGVTLRLGLSAEIETLR